MGVDGARIGRRLVDGDERNAGRVGALDVLQNGLVVPRNRDDAVDLLGDAGVDLRGLALSVFARDLLDQLDAEIRGRLSPELQFAFAKGLHFVERETNAQAGSGQVVGAGRHGGRHGDKACCERGQRDLLAVLGKHCVSSLSLQSRFIHEACFGGLNSTVD